MQTLGDKKTRKVLNNVVYLFNVGGKITSGLHNQKSNVSQSYQIQSVKTVIDNWTNTLKVSILIFKLIILD